MVQVIAAAAIGAVAWVGYNAFKKHMAEERRKEKLDAASRESATKLELDPETGRYKPRQSD